ncbi:putative outer membrane repeat protein [Elusimicrobium posterum]|uniref:autotransporter family protein n=1 Tax=Elusimicrobium posterum TaxID=3116653 RepID=UPI003C78092B
MNKRILCRFWAALFFLFFYGFANAVSVSNYNEFESSLNVGNNVELSPSVNIIKQNLNQTTIALPAGSNATITGMSSIIDLNSFGNMLTMTGNSTRLTINSLTLQNGNYNQNGGAISIEGGSTLEVTNGNFISNSAGQFGGAVYVKGENASSPSVFRSYTTNADAGKTIFNGNTAGGQKNAIYLDDYGQAYFNVAANTSVDMYDGISGSGSSNTYFEVSGAGDFNLYSTFDTIDLNNSSNFNVKEGALMNANALNNMAGARFSLEGNTVYIKEVNNSGTLAFDISTGTGVIVTETLNLNNWSNTLEVKVDNMTDTKFRKRMYNLINYENYSGTFGTVNIIAPVAPNSYSVSYGGLNANWVTLSMFGSLATTEFSKTGGLSFNQREAGAALDKISETVANNDPWDVALAEIEMLSTAGLKNALSGVSGYFISNVIRSAAASSQSVEIYDRIKNNSAQDETKSNRLWVQASAARETFDSDSNSLGDYKNISAGFLAGYDSFIEDKNLLLGVYGRFSDDTIKQSGHKADGTKSGLGVYGGYINEEWEVKALAFVSLDSFDTERYVSYTAATAEGEVKATTFGIDFEGALKFDIFDNTKFRPYGGFELANSAYKGFTESGAGLYDLDVDSGNYLRTAGRIGAGVQYEKGIFSFYGNLEGKLLLSGAEPEIEAVFKGSDVSLKSRGSKEGILRMGAMLGGSVRVAQGVTIFANTNISGAENYKNLYGNAGLRYTF